jgi:hypothetical protein
MHFFQAFCSLDMLVFFILFLHCLTISKVQEDIVNLHLVPPYCHEDHYKNKQIKRIWINVWLLAYVQ